MCSLRVRKETTFSEIPFKTEKLLQFVWGFLCREPGKHTLSYLKICLHTTYDISRH